MRFLNPLYPSIKCRLAGAKNHLDNAVETGFVFSGDRRGARELVDNGARGADRRAVGLGTGQPSPTVLKAEVRRWGPNQHEVDPDREVPHRGVKSALQRAHQPPNSKLKRAPFSQGLFVLVRGGTTTRGQRGLRCRLRCGLGPLAQQLPGLPLRGFSVLEAKGTASQVDRVFAEQARREREP